MSVCIHLRRGGRLSDGGWLEYIGEITGIATDCADFAVYDLNVGDWYGIFEIDPKIRAELYLQLTHCRIEYGQPTITLFAGEPIFL